MGLPDSLPLANSPVPAPDVIAAPATQHKNKSTQALHSLTLFFLYRRHLPTPMSDSFRRETSIELRCPLEEGALEGPSLLSDSLELKQLQRSFAGWVQQKPGACRAQRPNTCSRAFSPNTLHLGSAFLLTGLAGDKGISTRTSLSFPRSWLLASLRAPEPWIFVGEPGSGAGPRC